MNRIRRLHLVALAFYTTLAFIVLHGLLFKTNTHTAGYDFFAYNWNFWWARYALREGLDLFHSDYVMFPSETSYGFHTLTLFWFPLWALTEPFIGTLAAVNLILWLGCTLNGYLLFNFLRGEGATAGLALVAGAALQAFPIARYFYYNTHLNLMDWFWPPLTLILWGRVVLAAESHAWGRLALWAGVQGLAFWGLAHTDLQFPLFSAVLLVPYGLWTVARSPQSGRLVLAGLGAVGLFLALFWVAGYFPAMLDFKGTRVTSPVEDRPGVAFPEGLLYMSRTWWDWATPTISAFISLSILAGLIYGLWRGGWQQTGAVRLPSPTLRTPAWFWALLMLTPFLLALGPTLKIGTFAMPLPYLLLYAATDGMQRMPWRFAPLFVMAGAAFLSKLGAGRWQGRPPARTILFGLAFFLLAWDVRLFESGPLQPRPTEYAFHEVMRAETGDYGILDVPTGAGTGEVLLGDLRAIQFQWYGVRHQKRMVNGFIARAPLEHYWYLHTDDPMLAWLGQRRPLEPERVREQLTARIFDWPIGYIILHRAHIEANGGHAEEISAFLNTLPTFVCPVWAEGEAFVYRTAAHPEPCPPRTPPSDGDNLYSLDIGALDDLAYLGSGWHWAEVVGGQSLRWTGAASQATLYLDLPPQTYQLDVYAQAFHEARQLQVRVNGELLPQTHTIGVEGLAVYPYALPASLVGTGEYLQFELVYDGTNTPAEVLGGGDRRPLAVAVERLNFRPQPSP